jgi:hypothetical protein
MPNKMKLGLMPDEADRFAFDKFPRGLLAFQVSRRQFLPALVNDFLVSCDKTNGRPTFRLSELGTWEEEKLATVIPRVVKDCKINVEDGFVWGQPPKTGRPIKLFPLDSPATVAFNHINGATSIQEISEEVHLATGWEHERSFSYIRGLFLWLVLTRVCQPVN